MFFFYAKKFETSKDIKAEYKANPLKKKTTGKEEFRVSLSIPNTAKDPKVKTQISIENKITCRLIFDSSQGVEGLVFLTRRVAA